MMALTAFAAGMLGVQGNLEGWTRLDFWTTAGIIACSGGMDAYAVGREVAVFSGFPWGVVVTRAEVQRE
jgi:hypothetical protein